MAPSWFPVEFHAYSYGCTGSNKRTVFLEFSLDKLESSCLQRFVQREDGFGIFAVYLGYDVVAPFCLGGWGNLRYRGHREKGWHRLLMAFVDSLGSYHGVSG